MMQFSFMQDPEWRELDSDTQSQLIDMAFEEDIMSEDDYQMLDEATQKELKDFYVSEANKQKNIVMAEPERGFAGDVISHIARGVADLGELTGHGLKVLDPEGGSNLLDKIGDKVISLVESAREKPLLRPDVSEVKGEGFVKRGVMGGLQSVVPSLTPTLTGAGTGAAVGSFFGPVGTFVGGLAGATAGTLGIFGLGTYGQKRAEYKEQGISDEEAHKASLQHALVEGGIEEASNILGLLTFGFGKVASQPLKNTAKELLHTPIKTFAKNFVKNTALNELPTEMVQSVLGSKIDEKLGILPEGAWQEAAVETIIPTLTMSVLFATGAQGLTSIEHNKLKNDLNAKNQNTRIKAVQEVARRIKDKELKTTWVGMAGTQVAQDQPIDVNADFTVFKPTKKEEIPVSDISKAETVDEAISTTVNSVTTDIDNKKLDVDEDSDIIEDIDETIEEVTETKITEPKEVSEPLEVSETFDVSEPEDILTSVIEDLEATDEDERKTIQTELDQGHFVDADTLRKYPDLVPADQITEKPYDRETQERMARGIEKGQELGRAISEQEPSPEKIESDRILQTSGQEETIIEETKTIVEEPKEVKVSDEVLSTEYLEKIPLSDEISEELKPPRVRKPRVKPIDFKNLQEEKPERLTSEIISLQKQIDMGLKLRDEGKLSKEDRNVLVENMSKVQRMKAVLEEVEEPKLQTGLNEPGQGIDVKDVQKIYPKQEVFKSPDGSISVKFKNGQGLTIQEINKVSDEDIEFAILTGQLDNKGMILGITRGNKIVLNKDFANDETLWHETKHVLDNLGIITNKDNAVLLLEFNKLKQTGKFRFELSKHNDPKKAQEENIANTFAQVLKDRESYRNTPIGKIIQKVMDFFDSLWNLGRMSTRKLARQVESGKIYARKGKDVSTKIQPQFTYAGVKAKLDKEQESGLLNAVNLAESGMDNEKIRQETGWFKGADDKWRFEIDDSKAKWKIDWNEWNSPGTSEMYQIGFYMLEDVLDHPTLFEHYPELKGIKFKKEYFPFSYGTVASFNPEDNIIQVNPNTTSKEALTYSLHEIQHWIQHKEDFAIGGNTSNMNLKKAVPILKRQLGKELDKAENNGNEYLRNEIEQKLNLLDSYEEVLPEIEIIQKKIKDLKKEYDAFVIDFEKTEKEILKHRDKLHDSLRENSKSRSKALGKLWNQSFDQDKFSIEREKIRSFYAKQRKKIQADIDAATESLTKLREGKRKFDQEATYRMKDYNYKYKDKLRPYTQLNYESYKLLAGEIEARDVEERREMNEVNRKYIKPYELIGIDPEDFYVVFQEQEKSASAGRSQVEQRVRDEQITFDSKKDNKIPKFQVANETYKQPFDIPDVSTKFESFQYNIIDLLAPVSKVYKAIKKQIPEKADYLLRERNRLNRTAAALKASRVKYYEPIKQLMAKYNFDSAQVDEALYSRHAPEANERLIETNAKLFLTDLVKESDDKELAKAVKEIDKKFNKSELPSKEIRREYLDLLEQYLVDNDTEAALTIREEWEAFKEKPSGMITTEANEIYAKWRNNEGMQNILKHYDFMMADTLKIALDSGRINKKEYNTLKNTYNFYTPLYRKGFPVKKGYERTGTGIVNLRKDFLVRGGSKREAVNMLGNSMIQHEQSIVRAEKARAARAFIKLVRMNPNRNFWKINKAKEKTNYDAHGNIIKVPDRSIEANEIPIKVDGKYYVVSMNIENEHAMRIVNHLKGNNDKSGSIVRGLMRFNRILSMVNTSLNPEFLLTNFPRDLQIAAVNLNSTELNNMKTKIMSDIPKALAGLHNYLRGDGSSEWGQIAKDFELAGGKMDWTDYYQDVEVKVKKLDKELALYKKGNITKKTVHSILKTIEDYNSIAENAVRLAAYKNALDVTGSRDKASLLAKELTVNFGQKGLYGQLINSMYLFANAGIQGSARLISGLIKSKQARRMVGTMILAATGMTVANSFMGGEDDDGESYYNTIKAHDKERNLIIMIPEGNGKYIKIPLGWGLNFFWNIGVEAGEAMLYKMDRRESYDPLEGGSRLINIAMNAFNPLQSATLAQSLSPTLLDPIVQVSENKNWFGAPLMPEKNNFESVQTPDSERYWRSVRPGSKFITEWANRLSGGDKVEKGFLDVSPETLDLVLDTFTGGAGRFVMDTLEIPMKAIEGEDFDERDILFGRKLFGTPDKQQISQKFYENITKVKTLQEKIKEYPERRAEFIRNKNYRLIHSVKQVEKQIRKLRKLKKRVKSEDRKKQLQERIEKIQKRFNDKYYKRFKS